MAPKGHYYWKEIIRGFVNTKHSNNKPIACVWVGEMAMTIALHNKHEMWTNAALYNYICSAEPVDVWVFFSHNKPTAIHRRVLIVTNAFKINNWDHVCNTVHIPIGIILAIAPYEDIETYQFSENTTAINWLFQFVYLRHGWVGGVVPIQFFWIIGIIISVIPIHQNFVAIPLVSA